MLRNARCRYCGWCGSRGFEGGNCKYRASDLKHFKYKPFKYRMKGEEREMLKKLLAWIAISLFLLAVSLLRWEIAWGMVLIAAIVALAIGELYGRYKADREYKRNPEAALLIGRYSEGIDHKGRMTGEILRWPF